MPLAGQKLSAAEIKSLWLAAGGPPHEADVMTAIALAESSGYTGAWNPGRAGPGGTNSHEYSVGIWQINTYAHKNYSIDQLKDPQINAREAVRIYKLQGKRAWGAFTDGRFREYLPQAQAAPAAAPTYSPSGDEPTPTNSALSTATLLMLGFTGLLFVILLTDD
jgi:hypothetical protein